MFGLPSIRIGKIFGIPLEVNPTWLIIFGLVVFSLAFGYFPEEQGPIVNLASAAITALLFFASIVAHEMSHSLVARAGGVKVDRVTLFVFGGVAQMEDEPANPGREFVMAVAGPAMSLLLAASFFVALVIMQARGVSQLVTGPVLYLSFINFYVGVFNLLPGFPLDGGRVLRAALWALTGDLLKATRWASRSGQFIGYSMVAAAVFGVLGGSLNLIWLGLVGWFIASLADAAYRQQEIKSRLHELKVADIMTPHPATVSASLDVATLVRDYFLGGRHSRYPVIDENGVAGLVSLSQVKRVSPEEWPHLGVTRVADTDLASLVISADAPADDAIARLSADTPGALLVVRDGRMIGILTRADIVSRLAGPDVETPG